MATVNSPRVQSVDRAADLLRALAEHGGPASVPDLADRCGLNRSTAWRILGTLEHHGLVERDPATSRYTVGYAIVALAAAAGHEPLVRRAHPHLRALAEACAETASLAVPRRLQLVYVDQVQALHGHDDHDARGAARRARGGSRARLRGLARRARARAVGRLDARARARAGG